MKGKNAADVLINSYIFNSLQVFLNFQLIYSTDSVKQDKPYIDERELWKVTINVEDDQLHSEKVTYLAHYPSLCFSLFFLTLA